MKCEFKILNHSWQPFIDVKCCINRRLSGRAVLTEFILVLLSRILTHLAVYYIWSNTYPPKISNPF